MTKVTYESNGHCPKCNKCPTIIKNKNKGIISINFDITLSIIILITKMIKVIYCSIGHCPKSHKCPVGSN